MELSTSRNILHNEAYKIIDLLYILFLKILLFIQERVKEHGREREKEHKQGEGQRKKQTPC